VCQVFQSAWRRGICERNARRPYSGNNLRALRATFFTFFAALLAAFLALPILDFALLAIDPSRSLCFTFYVVGAIPHLYLCAWPSKTFEMML